VWRANGADLDFPLGSGRNFRPDLQPPSREASRVTGDRADGFPGPAPRDFEGPGGPETQAAQEAPGFLDYASGAPLHPAAREALLAGLNDGWADPARRYAAGRRARLLLDAAREAVAGVLGARPDEVTFPPSGTDAAQRAIAGTLRARRRVGATLVTSAVEHSCVLHAGETHEAAGGNTVLVGVDRRGRIDLEAFRGAVAAEGIALASLQSANHEIGTRQPVSEAGEACRAAGVPLHVDAAVTLGREPVDLEGWQADLVSGSARKWGGPPGIGVLVVRRGLRYLPPSPAPGAENLLLAVAAAASLLARVSEQAEESSRVSAYVERLRNELPAQIPDLQVHGDPDPAGRAPHILSVSCLYVDGESVLGELDRAGLAVNSGSSCTTDTLEPSHVLVAMGALTSGNLRISFGRSSTEHDVERLLTVLPAAVRRFRDEAGVTDL
jgi:cysteine desulfurase